MDENSTELEDAFFAALVKVMEHITTNPKMEDMPELVKQSAAGLVSPVLQTSSFALVGFLVSHVSAKNDLEEIKAYEELKTNLQQIAKKFKEDLDTQKRYAQQTMGIKFIPKQ